MPTPRCVLSFLLLAAELSSENSRTDPLLQLTTGVGAWHRDPALFLTKPFGFSSFAHEIASAPRSWAAQTGNLAFYRYHERVRLAFLWNAMAI